MTRDRGNRGVVLVVVLFFALLLTSSIATFLKRSTIDYMVSRHREDAAQAESVARGGVQIAMALTLDDNLQKGESIHNGQERWSTAKNTEIPIDGGSVLRLKIEDTGSKLNINSLYSLQEGGESGSLAEPALGFLTALLSKAVDEMRITPAEKELYDVQELAENLADFLDQDSERQRGGREDDFYERQDPPYTANNGPLLSVDELRLIEGFDISLAKALGDYVTVYPYVGGGGINPNTAPPHVLALLYASDGGSQSELANEEKVQEILDIRKDERILCPEEVSGDECTPIREIFPNPIFPPPTYASGVFLVQSKATVGEIERTVEAVIDISDPATPLLLSWHLR